MHVWRSNKFVTWVITVTRLKEVLLWSTLVNLLAFSLHQCLQYTKLHRSSVLMKAYVKSPLHTFCFCYKVRFTLVIPTLQSSTLGKHHASAVCRSGRGDREEAEAAEVEIEAEATQLTGSAYCKCNRDIAYKLFVGQKIASEQNINQHCRYRDWLSTKAAVVCHHVWAQSWLGGRQLYSHAGHPHRTRLEVLPIAFFSSFDSSQDFAIGVGGHSAGTGFRLGHSLTRPSEPDGDGSGWDALPSCVCNSVITCCITVFKWDRKLHRGSRECRYPQTFNWLVTNIMLGCA